MTRLFSPADAAASQQVLEPEVLDINEIVRTAVQLLGQTLGENIVIRTELEDPLWSVNADATKLSQVLMNLAINARDAMPNGGTLAIETRNVPIDSSYARLHIGLRPGDYVALVVSDTGMISPDVPSTTVGMRGLVAHLRASGQAPPPIKPVE